MDYRTQQMLERINENHQVYRKLFFWHIARNESAILSSFLSASAGKPADAAEYKRCRKILRKECGIFSSFRGIAESMVITKMTLAEDPGEFIRGSLEVYRKLRKLHKLTASAFMVMAAITIYENVGTAKADDAIAELEALYKALRKKHPLLVSDQDCGYLAALVCFGVKSDWAVEAINDCYDACKHITIQRDSVHSLAQILALNSDSTEVKVADVETYMQSFRDAGYRVSKSLGLPALAALTLLNGSREATVSDVCDTAEAMRSMRPFRWYYMTKRTRLMYATLITLLSKADETNNKLVSTITGTMTMVIIEQIILCIIIMSTSASASHSSSSSSSGS